jgi:transposase
VPIYGYGGVEAFRAHLFVTAMGASGCAYAEATRSESLPDWLGSHVRALEFYGAAPTIIVPDNPKVGVTRADRYEPRITAASSSQRDPTVRRTKAGWS